MAYDPNEACPWCLADMRVGRWDNMIGLPTRCRNCGSSWGPPWSVKRLGLVIFASFFLNIVVLVFVTRPLRALFLAIVYVASIAALFTAASALDNDAVEATAFIATVLGPACLATIEFFWHETTFRQRPLIPKSQPAPGPDAPRFLGTRDMELLRNEIEIAIFHQKERIAFLAKYTYFVAILDALTVALDRRWIDLSIPLLVAGLAYSVRAHESRAFAVAFLAFGAAMAIFYRHEVSSPAVLICTLLLGVAMIEASFRLAYLRRVRARIPLEPAPHLQD